MTRSDQTPSRPLGRRALDLAKSLVGPVVLFLILRAFVVEAFHIWPSGSMERTLLIGDFLFVNKALYGSEIPLIHRRVPGFRDPEHLDVVIFESVEEPGLTVVKRVIGIPGDTVGMRDNVLYRNGTPVEEPYVQRLPGASEQRDAHMREWQLPHLASGDPDRYWPTSWNWGPLVVPADSLFVMGDNRDESYDSRYWGFLARTRVRGAPILVYYSYDKDGSLPLPFLTAVRWGRILSMPR